MSMLPLRKPNSSAGDAGRSAQHDGGLTPKRLGPYVLLEKAFSDALGVAYLASRQGDAGFVRWLLVTPVSPRLAADKSRAASLARASRAIASVAHPNVGGIVDVHHEGEQLIVVSELLEGVPLRELLERQIVQQTRVPWDLASQWMADAASGMDAFLGTLAAVDASQAGVVRSIDPSAVIATFAGGARVDARRLLGVALAGESITDNDRVAYTPAWANKRSPGVGVTFTLATILWELVAGKRLFARAKVEQTRAAVRAGVVPKLSTIVRGARRALDDIVGAAITPPDRAKFGTPGEFAKALKTFLVAENLVVPSDDLARYLVSQFKDRFDAHEARMKSAREMSSAWIEDAQTPDPRTPLRAPPIEPDTVRDLGDDYGDESSGAYFGVTKSRHVELDSSTLDELRTAAKPVEEMLATGDRSAAAREAEALAQTDASMLFVGPPVREPGGSDEEDVKTLFRRSGDSTNAPKEIPSVRPAAGRPARQEPPARPPTTPDPVDDGDDTTQMLRGASEDDDDKTRVRLGEDEPKTRFRAPPPNAHAPAEAKLPQFSMVASGERAPHLGRTPSAPPPEDDEPLTRFERREERPRLPSYSDDDAQLPTHRKSAPTLAGPIAHDRANADTSEAPIVRVQKRPGSSADDRAVEPRSPAPAVVPMADLPSALRRAYPSEPRAAVRSATPFGDGASRRHLMRSDAPPDASEVYISSHPPPAPGVHLTPEQAAAAGVMLASGVPDARLTRGQAPAQDPWGIQSLSDVIRVDGRHSGRLVGIAIGAAVFLVLVIGALVVLVAPKPKTTPKRVAMADSQSTTMPSAPLATPSPLAEEHESAHVTRHAARSTPPPRTTRSRSHKPAAPKKPPSTRHATPHKPRTHHRVAPKPPPKPPPEPEEEEPTPPVATSKPDTSEEDDPPASSKKGGYLTVICIPACDEVRDGSKSLGPSPIFKAEVASGSHTVKLRGPDGETRTKSVSVKAGETTVIKERLNK